MKKVLFAAIMLFTMLSFTTTQLDEKIPITDWVTICTGTNPSTGTGVQLKSNGKGTNMLVKIDKHGQPTGESPTITTMDKVKFKAWCEDNDMTTNC